MMGAQQGMSLRRGKERFPTRCFVACLTLLVVVGVQIVTVQPGEPGTKPVPAVVSTPAVWPEGGTPKVGTVKRGQTSFVLKRRLLQGTIHGSLYAALAAHGESPQMAAELAEIFAWDIDFHTDLRRGDSFRVLIEERYRHGKSVGSPRILAAEMVNRQRVFQAVSYPSQADHGTYYRPDGSAIRRMFLRSPLHYSRISSPFSLHRFHPILGQYRPHLGIDYAAPAGTPVRSVADGVIAWAGMKGASGNMVEVRHNSVYSTFYLHLSRFASEVQVGKRVAQGEVIGYVGATGLATGPHLDFRLSKEGKYLNPLEHSNKSLEAPPLPRQALPAFRAHARRLLAELRSAPRRNGPW